MIGYNYRLEGIQGAVLSVSLKYLPEWTARRREIGWRYTKEITNPAITLQHHPENTNPVFHMFEVEVEDDPERFLAYMAENVPGHLPPPPQTYGRPDSYFPDASTKNTKN